MIELARANPAFRADDRGRADRRAGRDPAGRVQRRGRSRAVARELKELSRCLVADLGLPGAVVEMPKRRRRRRLWEVRKAGLNIMMSLKGDGKPVSFIEDCAVPLEHLADYTDALTEVFTRHGTRGTWYAHASVGTLHVRPILDMRRDGAAKMRASPRRRACWCASTRARTAASTAMACLPRRVDRLAVRPGHRRGVRAIKQRLDPIGLLAPNRIVDPPRMDDASLFRYPPAYRTIALKPVSTGRRGTCRTIRDRSDQRARQRRRPERRPRQGGRDVQQQRPLPQVRRRHDVPELSRHARRAAPDPRPREHAAPGALGPARGRRRAPSRWRATRCRRRWPCASAARAASATARPASTWRG
jgi:hypothetical protein